MGKANLPVIRKNDTPAERTQQNLKRKSVVDYLEPEEVKALIRMAPHPKAALLMLLQWRAGLRVSEALSIEPRDLRLDGDRPQLIVRKGKGNKQRWVPVHPELKSALTTVISFGNRKNGPIIGVNRSTAWRWIKTAMKRAIASGLLPPGRKISTHTLRHSAARHWLANGVPINLVSVWLGHSSIKTTADTYLPVLPDYLGAMERIP